MQRSKVTCLACRRQLTAAALNRPAALRPPQWHRRAPASTLSADKPKTQSFPESDYVPSIDDLDTVPPPTQSVRTSPSRDSASRFKHVPRRPHPRNKTPDGTEESLSLFKKVVSQQADEAESTDAPRDLPPVVVQYYNDVDRMRTMMKEESIDKCFEHFMTNIWVKPRPDGIMRLLKHRGAYLLGKVARAKMADMDNEKLPSAAQITQLLQEMGALSTQKWTELIMGLIKGIISPSSVRTDYPSQEAYETAMARKEELLEDLVQSWIVFHRHRLLPDQTKLQSSDAAEFRLPDIDERRLQYHAHRGRLRGALGLILPDFIHNSGGGQRVPAALIATYVLLTDPTHSNAKIREKAMPLLTPVSRILSAVPVKFATVAKMLEQYPEVKSYVKKLWDNISQHQREIAPRQGAKTGSHIKLSPGRPGNINTVAIHAKVTEALKMGDAAVVDAAWAQYWGKGLDDPARMEILRSHQGLLFDYFIMAFTAVRQPRRAIDVWDAMTKINVKPTLKTWTYMIEGCGKANNAVGLENVWKRLVESGEKLDKVVWTTRIVGLMHCKEPTAGLRALGEMLRMSRLPGGVELDITAINATVAGLVRLDAMSAARRVLVWASENGVEPDIFTFNTLLRPMVLSGDAEGVEALLNVLVEQKIEPDGATWTILLEGLVGKSKDATPEEQRLAVEKLLADMDAAGATGKMETYGRMMHLLIRENKYDTHHTEGAIGAIYDHILDKGLRPSVYIYTMLVEIYFRRDPPAIGEVERLLNYGDLQPGRSSLDRVFWERVISGFASHGHLDRAFALFQRASNVAAWMTLGMLETLLRCLLRGGRVDQAQFVVDTVKQHRARAKAPEMDAAAAEFFGSEAWPVRGDPGHSNRRLWKHGFWRLAMDAGLMSMHEWQRLDAGLVDAKPPPHGDQSRP